LRFIALTKQPIPLDLLVLESVDDDPVIKSSSSKFGVGTFTSHVPNPPESRRLSRQLLQSPISPIKSNEGLQNPGTASVTLIGGDADKEIMYPFRITHLGQAGASYTLYTSSSIDRDKWKDAIISAKREHSSAMYALNAEPFRMKVVADYAFGYDSSYSPKLPVFTAASAVDRALRETGNQDKPRPLVKSYINCGVSFVFADGNEYCMLGLDYGVYIHDGKPDSIWRRCLEITKVTQIDILEELNVVLLIADKALIYYHLDEVIGQTVKQSGSDKPPMGYRLCSTNEPKVCRRHSRFWNQ